MTEAETRSARLLFSEELARGAVEATDLDRPGVRRGFGSRESAASSTLADTLMAGSRQQPTDRRGQEEELTPQEGLDRGTRSLVLALGLLSALFFAGAVALAVGTGILSPSEPERERAAGMRPLPREWAGLDQLRPVVRAPRAEEGGGDDSRVAGIGGGGGGGPGASNGAGGGADAGSGPGGAAPGNAGPRPPGAGAAPASPSRLVSVPQVTTVVDSRTLPDVPDLIGGGPDLPDLPDIPDLGGGGVSLPPIDVPRVPLPPIAVPRPPRVVLPPIVPVPGGALPGLDPGGDGGVTVPPLLPTPELPTTPVVPPLLPLAADAAEAGFAFVLLDGGAGDERRRESASASGAESAAGPDEEGVHRAMAGSPSSEGASVGELADDADPRRGPRRGSGDRSTRRARTSGLAGAVARHVRCRLERPRRPCQLGAAQGGDRRRSGAAPDRGDDKPAAGRRGRSARGD